MARLAVLSLALFAALPACKDTPSYRLRWSLQGRPDPANPDDALVELDVTRSFHCSQLGVNTVRVRAIDHLGLVAHEDVYPCFVEGFEDLDETAEGPELRPGAYALEVRGVQRDLKEWIDPTPDPEVEDGACVPDGDPLGCGRADLVCDCQEFEAVRDETFTELDTFVLRAPPDCVDGIDNDVDGLVDGQDPGCGAREAAAGDCVDGIDNDGDGAIDDADSGCVVSESNDVSVVQFTLRVTLLDENPAATCTGVGLTRLHVTATAPGNEPVALATLECRVGDTLFFSAELPQSAEPYAIEIQGRDNAGNPITATLPFEDTVVPGSDAIVDLDIDIGADDFEPPIEAAGQFLIQLGTYPDSAPECAPGEPAPLVIPELSLQLLDLAGDPVPGATLRDGTPLDGTALECTASVLYTDALTWGGYRLAGEALAVDGTICFRTAPGGALLAPDSNAVIVLEPVLEGGSLPPACFDCTGAAGCS